ncbi:hypothetical protein [Zhouia amylolytica]|uniref:hypothetical protein n=1 Tax=Zhouia amylolytica TaxID=376730 RepID=UPI0020CFA8E4|nr:hypothetical protein [Zhouia amylolytica]MCQ0112636.1 hypothetical protein [Zhouia amylolytica]
MLTGRLFIGIVAFLLLPLSILAQTDWLINNNSYRTQVYENKQVNELEISNGLVKRVFRLQPNAATIKIENVSSGESFLRGVKPEARVTINGIKYDVGGLKGQPNYAFLNPEWLNDMTSDPSSMQFVGYEISEPKAPFEWKQVRYARNSNTPWPPKGIHLRMDYELPGYEGLIKGNGLLPSDFSRPLKYQTDFKTLDDSWSVFYSNSHERSSFQNEGKIGEIYTPANTAVYAERAVDPSTRIIEATFNLGTDKSMEFGPGITLVWPDKTVKFYIRPGGNTYDDGIAMFGLWDGEKSHKAAGGRQSLDISVPWSLRYRITDDKIYCEAKRKGGSWISVAELDVFESMPQKVRIGKTNGKGEGLDAENNEGELVRLQVMDYAAYGEVSEVVNDDLSKEDLKLSVHYEVYDGLPVIAKWISIENLGDKDITVNKFTSEIIAAVEYASQVEDREYEIPEPNIHVETDYAFASMSVKDANHHAVRWTTDPDYETQVNYLRKTPCLLDVGPELGPDQFVKKGETFTSFRTFVLLHDSYDRERQGLALRKMYRTLAPWTTENPLMMHARFADWDRVKKAIDQAAEVGFEMVILTFGSGFNIEDDSEEYLNKMKKYADYAKSKGIEIGGYSLLASRRVGGGNDVVMPPGERPTFGNSPCLESTWGQTYFEKLYKFYESSGFALLEHDGSYPGDICTSHQHPGHKGLEDSRWNQYRRIAEFYQWCRSKGIYLNIPDFYYMAGGNKCAMGYREVNWSLPREQQLIHARQNIFDGTWEKTSSMGWMFVPLTEYHGGGAAATIEPLNEHLDHYEMMMANNLGAGVQACYRGPRLYDTPATEQMVKKMVNWYKKHREVLEGDLIHLKRANGYDLDYWLNVNPEGEEKGLLMVFNPTNKVITKHINVPLYYTGIKDRAAIEMKGGYKTKVKLNRDYSMDISVQVPANDYSYIIIK